MSEAVAAPGRRRVWRTWAVEIALVLAVVVGAHVWRTRGVAHGEAPLIEAPGLAGEALSLAALRGKPVLVHFWATWCGVCRVEQGTIDALAKDHPVLTVASSSGGADAVREFTRKQGLSMPVVVDASGELARAYGVEAFPTSFIVAPDGKISFVEVGLTTRPGFLTRLWLAGL